LTRINIDAPAGAVTVVEHERLIGIFTERDALFRVIARGLDSRTTQLAGVMSGYADSGRVFSNSTHTSCPDGSALRRQSSVT
jgi:CBS domain-containing protein